MDDEFIYGRDLMRVNKNFKEKSRRLRKQATDAERHLWYELKNRQFAKYKFRRQYVIEPYIVDFICLTKKLIIELDGGQHSDQLGYDHARTLFLQERGYQVIRFWNDAIFKKPSPQPSPANRLIRKLCK
jgi:very-short-patch-repair endonuclease